MSYIRIDNSDVSIDDSYVSIDNSYVKIDNSDDDSKNSLGLADYSSHFPPSNGADVTPDFKDLSISVGISQRNSYKIKRIYQYSVDGRSKREKTTTYIKNLFSDDLKDLPPPFLQTWDKHQINLIPDDLISELSFEQLKAIIENIGAEKLFKNLKSIESNLTDKQIKKILQEIPAQKLQEIAERIATCSEKDILYFSTLSSVTIFFFLPCLMWGQAIQIFDKFPLKKIQALASKKAPITDLKGFFICLSDSLYLKVLNRITLERKIELIKSYQSYKAEVSLNRLFLTIIGMSNDEVVEAVKKIDFEILENIKDGLPIDKQEIIKSHLSPLLPQDLRF